MEERIYRTKKYLNKRATIAGIPLENIIVAIFGFAFTNIITSEIIFCVAGAILFALQFHRLKKGRGVEYIYILIWKYSPTFIQRMIFPNTPTSNNKKIIG